ncbi:PREDICTED: LOW QUALITY PROTEIN: schlafen family member 11-like [Calidris pugnax]|uniref:LOW QUALITY PROTEIN: schlafen family member 11-like n=1 Tax=Calidris pugnax TaxID=198806 RepID=UPI00071E4F3E|nr:PREDICTED: LOW QUALITY PROTEIN: schlafen family member 11-like [Calidris pugnax]
MTSVGVFAIVQFACVYRHVALHTQCGPMVVKGFFEGAGVQGIARFKTIFFPQDLSHLADQFKNELSLSNGPPFIRPVHSEVGLRCISELQESLYPVGSNEIKWKPETICTDLFSEYPGLQDLKKKQIHPLNKGVLIFSRSWAVDIGLPKKQNVVCDALLVAENTCPVLYAVVGVTSSESENWRESAYTLKQKLVNVGGYDSKVCVIPQIPHLNQMEVAEYDVTQQENQENPCGSASLYPENCTLTSRDTPVFLGALVILVLSFRSYLRDLLGCEIFSLLTLKQYELLSKNLHKVNKQFVLGLPGSGNTIMPLKILENICNIFHCSAEETLYICENQPLKKFVEDPMKYRGRLVFRSAENVLGNVIVIDSISHFSGLERRIIFHIHPVPAEKKLSSLQLSLCAASGAHTKLHLLFYKFFKRAGFSLT